MIHLKYTNVCHGWNDDQMLEIRLLRAGKMKASTETTGLKQDTYWHSAYEQASNPDPLSEFENSLVCNKENLCWGKVSTQKRGCFCSSLVLLMKQGVSPLYFKKKASNPDYSWQFLQINWQFTLHHQIHSSHLPLSLFSYYIVTEFRCTSWHSKSCARHTHSAYIYANTRY
jgi:hypothetical protein